MKSSILFVLTGALLCVMSSLSHALSIREFRSICDANSLPCHEIPLVHAYTGGALDMLATLDERTNDLATMYCKSPKVLFDMPGIVAYMNSANAPDQNLNAMTLLIAYVKTNGGCNE